MKIHEYQGKEILRKFGVAVPEGRVAFTPEEAEQVALLTITYRVVGVLIWRGCLLDKAS